MYEEHGYHYEPRQTARPKPPTPTPSASPQSAVVPLPEKRPFWLVITTQIILYATLLRFCAPLETENMLFILLQFGSASVMMVISIGLIRQRRWAAVMFALTSAWLVLSAVVVGIIRLTYVDEVAILNYRSLVVITILRDMMLSIGFYGTFGILYAIQARRFTSAGLNRYGNIPFGLMLAVMILFTAVQIANARADVALRADVVEDSQPLINDWFNE